MRGDSAACVHAVADFCREGDIRFSVGHELSAEVREAIGEVPDDAWVGAISQDGVPVAEHPTRPREAYVAELTGLVDLSTWPQASRLICRRERAHPGAQLSLIDTDGWRHQCFLTDQVAEDIAELDRLPQGERWQSTPTSMPSTKSESHELGPLPAWRIPRSLPDVGDDVHGINGDQPAALASRSPCSERGPIAQPMDG